MNARRLFLKYRTKREPQDAAKQRSCGSFAEWVRARGSLLHPGLALFNKLLCHPGAAASGADSKGLGLYQQLIHGHIDAVLLCQLCQNGLEPGLLRALCRT